jgi:hypothetical protein
VLRIRGHADNDEVKIPVGIAYDDAFADGVRFREVVSGECFIDEANALAIAAVLRPDVAAFENRNARSRKKVGPY